MPQIQVGKHYRVTFSGGLCNIVRVVNQSKISPHIWNVDSKYPPPSLRTGMVWLSSNYHTWEEVSDKELVQYILEN